jgi:hypothetical protein
MEHFGTGFSSIQFATHEADLASSREDDADVIGRHLREEFVAVPSWDLRIDERLHKV